MNPPADSLATLDAIRDTIAAVLASVEREEQTLAAAAIGEPAAGARALHFARVLEPAVERADAWQRRVDELIRAAAAAEARLADAQRVFAKWRDGLARAGELLRGQPPGVTP